MDTAENRNRIIKLWANVEREGFPDLIDFLAESDFFTAPCSTMFHLAIPGGLAQHSLNVYELLTDKVFRYKINASNETIMKHDELEPYPETWGKGAWTAKTLDDAKQMAIDFAESVS